MHLQQCRKVDKPGQSLVLRPAKLLASYPTNPLVTSDPKAQRAIPVAVDPEKGPKKDRDRRRRSHHTPGKISSPQKWVALRTAAQICLYVDQVIAVILAFREVFDFPLGALPSLSLPLRLFRLSPVR